MRYERLLCVYLGSESKALPEHVPFTCSSAYKLFSKVLGTMGGSRVRVASVTGTVITVAGLI